MEVILLLLLAAILVVLIWTGSQVRKLVEILSFLSIRWQKHTELIEKLLVNVHNAVAPGRIASDQDDETDDDENDDDDSYRFPPPAPT